MAFPTTPKHEVNIYTGCTLHWQKIANRVFQFIVNVAGDASSKNVSQTVTRFYFIGREIFGHEKRFLITNSGILYQIFHHQMYEQSQLLLLRRTSQKNWSQILGDRGGGAGGAGGAIAPPNISLGEQRSPNSSQAIFCIYRTAKLQYLCLLWGTDSKR